MRSTRKLPKPRKVRANRTDAGWENIYTGLGLAGRDKRLGATFRLATVAQEDAEDIWRGDDIAARMVEVIPNEMLREGFEICIQDLDEEKKPQPNPAAKGPPSTKGDDVAPLTPNRNGLPPAGPPEADPQDSKELAEDIEAEHRKLGTMEHIRQALYFSRAFGGAGILLGADDGRDWEEPLNEERVKSFTWMNVFTPRELLPWTYYSDPVKPRYGDVATYKLVPLNGPPGAESVDFPTVHESRLVRFNGMFITRGARLTNDMPGWDDSIFARVLQVVNDFQAAWQGAAILMQDFAPATLKMKGLAKLMGSKGGATGMADRARALEMTSSIARVRILDADGEEFTRETTSVTGLAELLEKLMLRLAASAGMPVSLLMGQSPAGLNATGDSDIRWFYDQVAALQERLLRPALMRITRLMLLAKAGPAKGKEPDNWDLKFRPLWQHTEAELAQMRFVQAQADALYIENQVLTPQEIARSRFGGDGYSTETQIDTDLRDQMDNPDDEMVRLGAGAAEDKQKEQDLAAKAAEKPAVMAKPPPPKG